MQSSPDKGTPQQKMARGREKIGIIILAIVIISLVAVLVYKFVGRTQTHLKETVKTQNNSDASEKDKLMSEIDNLDDHISAMEEALNSSNVEKEQMQLEFRALYDRINQNKLQINKLIQKEQEHLEEKRNLQSAKKHLEDLLQKVKDNEVRLEAKVAGLDSTVTATKIQLSSLQDSLMQKNMLLNRAAKLSASDFTFRTFNVKGNSVEKATQTQYMTLCFNVLRNELAPKGNRDFFFVLEGMGGAHFASADPKQSTIYTGKDTVRYSTKTQMLYEGETKQACAIYYALQKKAFPAGFYKIALYTQDKSNLPAYLIGQDVFELK